MERFILKQKAGQVLPCDVLAGVVGSGDLEVLYHPSEDSGLTIDIETSVNGQKQVWEHIFSRLAAQRELPSGRIEIHDFGATPGVIRLRLEQAFQKAQKKAVPVDYSKEDNSFIELSARERAQALLDMGSFREILGPSDHVTSPWLEQQGIVVSADDGMVIAKGTMNGVPTVVAAIEGVFQGGSMGEVSGAKMATALELAAEDNRKGIATHVVLLLETGGVRLQEANLGLAAIADIHAAIVDLRRYTPVVGVISGTVGCFGGMSIAAGLCSRLIVTEEARLGLNGPQVIEQEAGIEEYDSRDRPFIWSVTGGAIRFKTGFADALVQDSIQDIRKEVLRQMTVSVNEPVRSDHYEYYLHKMEKIDPSRQVDQEQVIALLAEEKK